MGASGSSEIVTGSTFSISLSKKGIIRLVLYSKSVKFSSKKWNPSINFFFKYRSRYSLFLDDIQRSHFTFNIFLISREHFYILNLIYIFLQLCYYWNHFNIMFTFIHILFFFVNFYVFLIRGWVFINIFLSV